MARRNSRGSGLVRSVEIGLGMGVLVGLLAYFVAGRSQQESSQLALFAGGVAFGIWLVRPLARWVWLKLRRFHTRNRRWWARRSSGASFALGVALLTAIGLYYGFGWETWPSLQRAFVVGVGVFALWLVRPVFQGLVALVTRASGGILQALTAAGERRAVKRSISKPRAMTQSQLQRLSPRAFEELCAAIARAWGYEARAVGQSGDGGIDVEMWRDGEYVVAQCKRYQGTVPITHVRDFYGAMIHVGATRGYFFTSGRFSEGAYEFIQGKPLELIDGNYLANIMARLDG